MELMKHTSADNRAVDTGSQLHRLISSSVCAGVNSSAENSAHAMLICGMASVAALHQLAQAVSPIDRGDVPLTSTSVLFAAFLAYRMAPLEYEKGRVQSEFSPIVLAEALKDFERFTGQKPDELLNEQMCRVCRKLAADPKMIAAIEAEKAALGAHQGERLH